MSREDGYHSTLPQLTSREINLLAETSTSHRVETPNLTLLSFPLELLQKIVLEIITSLVDEVIDDDFDDSLPPINVLLQYRNLVLTCKTFHDIIQYAKTQITIMTYTDDFLFNFVVWWGDQDTDHDYTFGDHDAQWPKEYYTRTSLSFLDFFRYWQIKVARREMYLEFDSIIPMVGRFHLNPWFSGQDVSVLCSKHEDTKFLQLLGRYFYSSGRRQAVSPQDQPQNRVWSITQMWSKVPTDFEFDQYVSSVDDHDLSWKSVGKWWSERDDTICGERVSAEVKEWWVWTRPGILCFAGYVGYEAWVYDALSDCVLSSKGVEYIGPSYAPKLNQYEEYSP